MSNEIHCRHTTGLTLYAIIEELSTLKIWDGDSFETSPTWEDCAIPLTEHALVLGNYYVDFPAGIITLGQYAVYIYEQPGALPVNTDTYTERGWIVYWSGTAEISFVAMPSVTVSDKTGFSISGTKQTLDALNDITAAAAGTDAASKVLATPSNKLLSNVSGQVSVYGNSDKTGYSLSTAGILAIWHQLTSAVVTAATMGKLIIDYLNAAITSRSSHSAANVKTAMEAEGGYLKFVKDVSEGDVSIETTTTPWNLVVKIKGTATELIRKELKDINDADITAISTVIGKQEEPA